jgi:hypothetical protein
VIWIGVARIVVIAVSLGLWFWSQSLLAKRVPATDETQADLIRDRIHDLTARLNQRYLNRPGRANLLLITSSIVIDCLGLYLLGSAIFGRTIEPFLGLLMLFALRQICQLLCPLPPPKGMIWRKPGFPALLVTYGTANDLFFSGHTAIAVYAAATLATTFGTHGTILGILIALFEILAVLVLRAHYTMDVFTGAVTALYVHHLATIWSPAIDHWIAHTAMTLALAK